MASGRERLTQRRSIRLRGYDYSRSGAYYVTIATQDRRKVFGEADGATMHLTAAGEMIRDVLANLSQHVPGVGVDAFIVMPDHVHCIVVLDSSVVADTAEATSLPAAIGRFKSFTTHVYTKRVREEGWPPFNGRLWQRNYYERVIRSDVELEAVRTYIAQNPCHWSHDAPGSGIHDMTTRLIEQGGHGDPPLRMIL